MDLHTVETSVLWSEKSDPHSAHMTEAWLDTKILDWPAWNLPDLSLREKVWTILKCNDRILLCTLKGIYKKNRTK